jgi:hypothetical protein
MIGEKNRRKMAIKMALEGADEAKWPTVAVNYTNPKDDEDEEDEYAAPGYPV